MLRRGAIALITGAGRRIGAATARALASKGCHVAVHYRTSKLDAEETAESCRSFGVRATTFAADLARSEQRESLMQAVMNEFSGLDLLINNASTFTRMSHENFDLAEWRDTLEVNLTAPMHLTLLARESLQANRGCVVNLCDAATRRPWSNYLAYMASKGGLETLTQALARALAPSVRVFGVAPGLIEQQPDVSSKLQEKWIERIPLQRAGTADEVAAVICGLIDAGSYLTGNIVYVDGGRSIV